MLLARNEAGDRERARTLLSEASALYDALGMTVFSSRARALVG
jgi:hypothetical protein